MSRFDFCCEVMVLTKNRGCVFGQRTTWPHVIGECCHCPGTWDRIANIVVPRLKSQCVSSFLFIRFDPLTAFRNRQEW